MNLEEIVKYYENRPRTYLAPPQAVCYVLSVLLEGDSYGTELISRIEFETEKWAISDTVLYQAIDILIKQGMIEAYWLKMEGRGRPRRMLKLLPDRGTEAEKLADLWLAEAGKVQEWRMPTKQAG